MKKSSISDVDFTDIPFDKITKLGQYPMLYGDMMYVGIILDRFCNYNCSYCWPHARSDTRSHFSVDTMKATVDEIKRQSRAKGFNSFQFTFSGGEATLYPNYLQLLEHLAEDTSNCNYQSMRMASNLSPGIRWFDKFVQSTSKFNFVGISASWHREQGIKEGDLSGFKEKFAEKILYLQENDIEVLINIVMLPELFDEIYTEAEYFHNMGINVSCKPLFHPITNIMSSDYTPEQLSFMQNDMPLVNVVEARRKMVHPQPIRGSYANIERVEYTDLPITKLSVELIDNNDNKWHLDHAERLNSAGFNKFTNWMCYAGYRSFMISAPSGYVRRGYSCADDPLGHIETGFKLFDGPKLCITDLCSCSADSKIMKYKV